MSLHGNLSSRCIKRQTFPTTLEKPWQKQKLVHEYYYYLFIKIKPII